MKSLVTMIIPTYNHERFVAETIRSVWAQTHRPLELVVIDDGSTDDTPAVVESMLGESRKQLNSVVFIRQRNCGLPRTLNRAITLARGEFVSIIASDDVNRPNKIERLLTVPDWADERLDAAFGDTQFVDDGGHPVGVLADGMPADLDVDRAESSELHHWLREWSRPFSEPLGTYESLLGGSYIPAAATLLRTRSILQVGGYDERLIVEDYPMWLKLSRRHPMAFVDEQLAHKRVHGTNMSTARRRALFRDVLLVLAEQAHYCTTPETSSRREGTVDGVIMHLFNIGRGMDVRKALVRHPFVVMHDLRRFRRQR